MPNTVLATGGASAMTQQAEGLFAPRQVATSKAPWQEVVLVIIMRPGRCSTRG